MVTLVVLHDIRYMRLQEAMGYPGYPPSGGSERLPGRAPTWHEFGSERTSIQASREAAHSEPIKIRPTYPFPTLHLIQDPGFGLRKSLYNLVQGAFSGDESDEEEYFDRSKEKLIWVDALNKWIPEHQLHPRPYLSFVGNPPVVEKQGVPKSSRESQRRYQSAPGSSRGRVIYMPLAYTKEVSFCSSTPGGGEFIDYELYERYGQHMGRGAVSQPSQPSRQRASEKREEIRRRAEEIAEQRRQRKAYSTPLYTSLTERRTSFKERDAQQKARIKSSRAPASTPVSPVQEKPLKAPPPKEVWQPKEGPKDVLKSQPEKPPASAKKEISITLMTPKVEDVSGDAFPTPREKGDKGDKHVKFQQEQTPRDKKGKTKNEEEDKDNSNNNAANASDMAEKNLIDALEKQRKQQLAEEQRLLQEQQKEKERLERERKLQAEKERLEKERERLQQLEKDPKKHGLMNGHRQTHQNYYESTMSAVGYYHKAENKTDAKDIEQARNKNLNRGVLKPREPVKYTEAVKTDNKFEKRDRNLVNTSKPRLEKIDNNKSNNAKLVPGGTNHVPSKTVKKENNNIVNKETVKKSKEQEKEEAVTDGLQKESSFIENGSKRRKGKGDGTKAQKKKTSKEKTKKKVEEEVEEEEKEEKEKHQPEPIQDPTVFPVEEQPDPVISAPSSSKLPKTKHIEKKTKRGYNRVKGAQGKTVKPMLTGMSTTPKPVSATSPVKRTTCSEEKLTVSTTQDLIEPPKPPVSKPETHLKQQLPQERRKSVSQRAKERKDRVCEKTPKEEKKLLYLPPEVKKVESWIYEKEDFSTSPDVEEEKQEQVPAIAVPSFRADLEPEEIKEEEKKRSKEARRKSTISHLVKEDNQAKKWRKPGKLDTSYSDELLRLELGERRKRQMEILERIRDRKMKLGDEQDFDGSPHFEDYGFLSKYCIFTKGNLEMYRHAFDAVDDQQKSWLEGEEVMIALRGVNSRLTEAEEEYLYRILELTGYKVTNGADFKMFSVLAALSQRIVALDAWMRNLIGKMDFKMLEMKMFMCKTLWECNVDPETNKISIDQLCVDLRAGGVSFEHEMEVREKLAHLDALDLLDFLTYVPLFIMIHKSVVQNPLDDTREK